MLDVVICNCVNRHYVVRLRSEKHGWVYSCQAHRCRKVFQELVFLYKHLHGKHPKLVREVIIIASDAVYLHNYMKDPNAPYPEQISDLPSAPPVVVPITGVERAEIAKICNDGSGCNCNEGEVCGFIKWPACWLHHAGWND